MFFKTNKNIAAQIISSISQLLMPPFVMTDYVKNGEFFPPAGFWEDKYVFGFTVSMTNFVLMFDLGGSRWSKIKLNEVSGLVFQILIPFEQFKKLYAMIGADEDIGRGIIVSRNLYALAKGVQLSPEEYDEAGVQRAKEQKQFHDRMIKLTLGEPPADLSTSYAFVTIHEHIRKTFLNKKS